MKFELKQTTDILERTPTALAAILKGLPDAWTMADEGPDTWSPYVVLGHLIHGERTDWIARLEIILSDGENKTFASFDRFAQFSESKGKTLTELLNEFAILRKNNLEILKSKNLTESDFTRQGIHPVFGPVTLAQLLSTWAVHDLNHLSQITRVMAFQYKEEVGPWIEYLRILK